MSERKGRRIIYTDAQLAAFKDGSRIPVRKVVTPAAPGLVVPDRELVSVSAKELMEQAAKDWRKFAGREVPIGEPTEQFLDFLEKHKGREHVGVAYWPGKDLEFKEDSNYPGWKVRPNDYYWTGRETNDKNPKKGIPINPFDQKNMWIVYDTTPRPNYDSKGGDQVYPDDPFRVEDIMNNYKRFIGSIVQEKASMRFYSSKLDLEFILTQLAEREKLGSSQVRLPTVLQFNVLGNMYNPDFGEADTKEWLSDEHLPEAPGGGKHSRGLIGGYSKDGGCSYVTWRDLSTRGVGDIGFRPFFLFPGE